MVKIYQQLQEMMKREGQAQMLTYVPADTRAQARKFLIGSAPRHQEDVSPSSALSDVCQVSALNDILDRLNIDSALLPDLMAAAERSLAALRPEVLILPDGALLLAESYVPEPRLIILGGGTVSAALAPWAAALGLRVTVGDDRLTFANKKRFPTVDKVICAPFREMIDELEITAADYVVIVTRGHQYDCLCLERILAIHTAYLGMIGSRSRVREVKAMMIDRGFSEERVNALCAPVGLNIGAVTPEEIAVSILAQLICRRRLGSLNPSPEWFGKKADARDMDEEVLDSLADEHEKSKRALLTVLSAKGSVPRGAGAKMLLWPDGRLLGSIGGGCSEGGALKEAASLMDEGGNRLIDVDLTNEVAAEEGMACGGKMRVLIETIDAAAAKDAAEPAAAKDAAEPAAAKDAAEPAAGDPNLSVRTRNI